MYQLLYLLISLYKLKFRYNDRRERKVPGESYRTKKITKLYAS